MNDTSNPTLPATSEKAPETQSTTHSTDSVSFQNSEIGIGVIAIGILLLVSLFDFALGFIAAGIYLGLTKGKTKKSRTIFYSFLFLASTFRAYNKTVGHENAANLIGFTIFSALMDVGLAFVIDWLISKFSNKKPALPAAK